MVRLNPQRVLLIGDSDRQMQTLLNQALPRAQVKTVDSVFDGIAELSAESYAAVLAAVEPMERRPDTAVRTLRQLAGQSRLLLFGHPTLEPLSQKMLEFGCDDYLVTPTTAGELLQLLGADGGPSSVASLPAAAPSAAPLPAIRGDAGALAVSSRLLDLRPADAVVSALLDEPHQSLQSATARLGAMLGQRMQLSVLPAQSATPIASPGNIVISRPISCADAEPCTAHLQLPAGDDTVAAGVMLDDLARLLGKVQAVQHRHLRLQKLAITDELTGINNGRYMRHFLTRIIEKARVMRFPVTLLMFDIDNLKKYNDQFGHSMGDKILKQTASLMRRCCRDHDMVARLGGDEFAVVFWEKEGPRQPRPGVREGPAATREGAAAIREGAGLPRESAAWHRPPSEPQQILDRFRRLLATQDFPALGPGGQGSLTISGGLAVYPYDAQDVQSLIDAADRELMFGAKRAGRNRIHLVGGDTLGPTVARSSGDEAKG